MKTQSSIRSALVLFLLFLLAPLLINSANATTFMVTVGAGGGRTFTPATVTIAPGDTVQWNWAASFHSVTSGTAPTPDGNFDSGVQNAGFIFSFTFPSVGTFPYFCTVHGAMMSGTINVVAATATPSPTSTPTPPPPTPTPPWSLAFSPNGYNFGSVTVGASSAEKQFFLACGNFSSGCPNISVSLTGPDVTNFSITADNCSGHTLGFSEACSVKVQFNPLTNGLRSASLAGSAACSCPPQNPTFASLAGTGLASPTPTATPATVVISGTVIYCWGNPNPNPVPNVTLNLTGTTTGSTTSDSLGNYQFSGLTAGGNYTVTPAKSPVPLGTPGMTTVDVIAVQRHFLNITPLTGCKLIAGDVNHSGTIDTVDLLPLQRFVLQYPTGTGDVGKYQFTPTTWTYSGIVTDQTNQNYDVLVFGDVAGPAVH